MGKSSLGLLRWGLATVVLLLSMWIMPLMICLLMVPLLVQYVKLDTKRFLLFYGVSMVVAYLLASLLFMGGSGLMLIAVSLFFLPPVIQIGNQYKKGASAKSVLTVGTVTLLGELLLSLVICYAFGIKLIDQMKQFFLESLETLPAQLQNVLVVEKETIVQLAGQLVPLYMIGFSFLTVLVTHGLSRKLLNRRGERIHGLKPIREWMLHRSWVWYYVIALFMEIIVKDTNSVFFMILLNLLPLLSLMFVVQAISFLFFAAHQKGWNRAMPIVAIVIAVMFTPAYFLLSLLGVFDVAFPLRERITQK